MTSRLALALLLLLSVAQAAPSKLEKELQRALAQAGDDLEAQVAAVEAVASADDPAATPLLARLALRPQLGWPLREAARAGLLRQEGPQVLLWASETVRQDKDPAMRTLGCDVLAARVGSDERAGKLLLPALADDHWSVQVAAIRGLRQLRERVVVTAMVKQLERSEGRVAGDLMRALRELTGEGHGSAAEWSSWWAAVGEDYTPPTPGAAEEQPAPDPSRFRTVTRLEQPGPGGRTIYDELDSSRLVFVVDVSYSMRVRAMGDEANGLTRLDYVRAELSAVIDERLDDDDLFNVIAFSDAVKPWKTKLVKATRRNKKAALRFVQGLAPEADTNVSDALELAFRHPDVDTIHFLSDGTPTKGALQTNEEILGAVRAWNAGRGVRLCTVAFLAGDGAAFQVVENKGMAARFLRALAEENQGTFRAFQ